ncbi:MAG TPA: hypothetical protein VFQ80_12215, partial [Thermomicrobiales bacterium]|nr:hypothetical protein [Thermomicrobiales bacterium]
TDPAGGAAATGQRYVEATIAMQNLTTSSLSLAPEMFQVRDLTGGLHIPISTASGGGAPGATPAAGKRAAPAATSAKSAKADKSAKPAKPTKPAKASKATQATQAAQAAHGARSAATPRAGVAKRSGKNGAAPASFTGAGIALAPGQTRTETLRFAVPASARVGSILFAPDQNHLISLAILPQSASSSPAASSAGSDRAAKAAKPGKPVKARATPKR